MTDCRNDAEEREFLMERWKLSLERIRQIPDETSVPVAYREYFSETAKYIVKLQEVGGRLKNGVLETADEDPRAGYPTYTLSRGTSSAS